MITIADVRDGLRNGGYIKYIRLGDKDSNYWQVFFWDKDGTMWKIVSGVRLNDRTFPNAGVLIRFHLREFPETTEFLVPIAFDNWSQPYSYS